MVHTCPPSAADAGFPQSGRAEAVKVCGPEFVRLSVVIPTFNRADRLREQLAALASQEYPAWWEVVVADNRCTDHTRAVLAEFVDALPLRVVDANEHAGRPYAVSAGAAASTGDAMITVDDDDVVLPGYLRATGAALARDVFVGAWVDVGSLNPTWAAPRCRTRRWRSCSHRPSVIGAAFGVRLDAFRQVGGCDESLECLEDVDLSWRLQYAGQGYSADRTCPGQAISECRAPSVADSVGRFVSTPGRHGGLSGCKAGNLAAKTERGAHETVHAPGP